MKIDNTQTAIKIQMQKRLIAVVVAVLVALLYFISEFSSFLINITGLPKTVFTIFFLLFFFVFYFYHLFAASSFTFYSDEEGKIIVRFYQLNGFNTSKLSYEIPKSEFTSYRLEYKYFKLRENLILFRKFQGNIVRYPPLSISALTKDERKKLLLSLNQNLPKT
ncbi:MAG: hypothetical protein CVT98_10460 [Bacteroidetes bacterium HGW-Bacteroidetes-15]|nr:MAG: hypothetical protein CVT98_10460 [Bacteroidetes bacterium HGW-Bacteroidetes-15]